MSKIPKWIANKIPNWAVKLIPKMYLPSSGQISLGMVNYDEASGDSGTLTATTDLETSEISMLGASNDYGVSAEVEGTTSRANLMAAPYALSEFYAYSYNCLLYTSDAADE